MARYDRTIKGVGVIGWRTVRREVKPFNKKTRNIFVI